MHLLSACPLPSLPLEAFASKSIKGETECARGVNDAIADNVVGSFVFHDSNRLCVSAMRVESDDALNKQSRHRVCAYVCVRAVRFIHSLGVSFCPLPLSSASRTPELYLSCSLSLLATGRFARCSTSLSRSQTFYASQYTYK